MENNSELIIYTTEDGLTKVDVTFQDDTVWLTQEQMADLFQKAKSTINEHIRNIYDDGELEKENTLRKFGNTEFSTKPTNFYNLDMIISVGYRVRSQRGVQFRIWASGILKEYMKKGFAMDDKRLKELGGGGYFKELIDRIRDIRASEKVFYRQILEIYATSIDYNPKAEEYTLQQCRVFLPFIEKLHRGNVPELKLYNHLVYNVISEVRFRHGVLRKLWQETEVSLEEFKQIAGVMGVTF